MRQCSNRLFIHKDKYMDTDKILLGKKLLIVDDEKDIRDTLFDLLDGCKIDRASSYEEARRMFHDNDYDIAILDIMGVNGYELLEEAKLQGVPAIMLTAHALTEENLVKSAENGAVYYAPKEELVNIKEIVAEVLDAIENKKSTWAKMFDRLSGFYDQRFNGPEWREKRRAFWEEKAKKSGLY